MTRRLQTFGMAAAAMLLSAIGLASALAQTVAERSATATSRQFMVVSRTDKAVSRTYTASQLKALIARDVAHTKKLFGAGVLRHMWSRRDDAGAVQLFEAADIAAVRAALAGYPMVTQRIVQVEIYPLAPYGGLTAADGGNDAAASQMQ